MRAAAQNTDTQQRWLKKRLTLALFAIAILFSMIREWSAPAACARAILIRPAIPSQ